jgi:hypothetical protein
MSRKRRTSKRNQAQRDRRWRRLAIRTVRRNPPDSDKLGRALIEIAQAELARKEAEARAQREAEQADEKDEDPKNEESREKRGEEGEAA